MYHVNSWWQNTTLSWASTHGHLDLKHQKLRVDDCTEEVLGWFNYPHPSADLGCEVSCQSVPNQPASLFHPYLVEASPTVEKAIIVLGSGRPIALLPMFISCSTRILHSKRGTLWIMVAGYRESLEKPQNCQIGRWALAWGWALAWDNTVIARRTVQH